MKHIDPPTTRHNWPDYCDGEWRLAEAGVDFTHPSQFQHAAKSWAHRHNVLFTSKRAIGGIKFCMIYKDAEDEQAGAPWTCDHEPRCEYPLPLHAEQIGWTGA